MEAAGGSDSLIVSPKKEVTSVKFREIETVIRFNHRILTFPISSPPPTPTKPGSGQGNRLGSPEVDFARVLDENERIGFNNVEISSSLRGNGAAEQGLGREIVQQNNKRLTHTPPATPELKQDFQFASYQLKFPLISLKNPNGTLYINRNPNADGCQFVDDAKRGGEIAGRSEEGEATLHSNNRTQQFPLTPPMTPKEAHLTFAEDVEAAISTETIQEESTSEDSVVNVKLQTLAERQLIDTLTLSLLDSINTPKFSCSGCTYFPVEVQVFTTLANALTLQLPEIKRYSQIHPAMITHIIALIPAATTIDRVPRFFAMRLNSTYQEVDFHTLMRYQRFRGAGFQIECFNHCGRHNEGYTGWKFSCRESSLIGCGNKSNVLSPLQMARYKQGVLVRKLSYYAR